jgi:hypothetical protein
MTCRASCSFKKQARNVRQRTSQSPCVCRSQPIKITTHHTYSEALGRAMFDGLTPYDTNNILTNIAEAKLRLGGCNSRHQGQLKGPRMALGERVRDCSLSLLLLR